MTADITISNLVISKIAAYAARHTPGVSRLQPAVLASATRSVTNRLPTHSSRDDAMVADGVRTRPGDGPDAVASITINVVLHVDAACLATATAIQERVDRDVRTATGLATVVTVNIVEIDLRPAARSDLNHRPGAG